MIKVSFNKAQPEQKTYSLKEILETPGFYQAVDDEECCVVLVSRVPYVDRRRHDNAETQAIWFCSLDNCVNVLIPDTWKDSRFIRLENFEIIIKG